MTNEQLAVLLGSYLERLRAISENIKANLPDGAERALEWWRGDHQVIVVWEDQEKLESKGWELRPTGEPLILVDLRDFISKLQRDLRDLILSKRVRQGNRVFIVLGMHGGGTSLVAGMLDALSIDMHYNPKAQVKHYLNYEDTNFVALNAQILAAAGGKWDNPPSQVEILSVRDDFEVHIKDLITERSDSQLWGFKDPRTALTVGLYHPWLPNPQYIYVKREVEGVVQSIMSRGPSGKDEVYWAQLVATYYERIETFLETVDVPVLRLDFEKLRTERDEALRLAEFVDCANEVDKAIEVIIG